VRRGAELARALRPHGVDHGARAADLVGEALPGPLRNPRSVRARQCVVYIAAHPGASNRQIGDGIGLGHRGQLSKLLQVLNRHGLLAKTAGRPGHANSWRPTSRGQQVAGLLGGAAQPARDRPVTP
jgi:hypothetical protein